MIKHLLESVPKQLLFWSWACVETFDYTFTECSKTKKTFLR